MSGRSYWSLTANKHAHFRAFVQEGDPGHVGDLCLCGGQAGTPEHLELLLCEAKWTQLVKCSLQAAFRASRRNWALPQLSSSALFWRSLPHFWSSDWIYKFPTDYRRGLRSLDQREISTLQHTTVGTVFRRTPGREYNRGKWNLLKGKQRLKISVNQSAKNHSLMACNWTAEKQGNYMSNCLREVLFRCRQNCLPASCWHFS